jgi:hypothetical protein
MPNYSSRIVGRIEALPISVVNRNLAKANFAASEASIKRFADALAWLKSVGLKYVTG